MSNLFEIGDEVAYWNTELRGVSFGRIAAHHDEDHEAVEFDDTDEIDIVHTLNLRPAKEAEEIQS